MAISPAAHTTGQGQIYQNFIAGEWRGSASGKTFSSTNPANTNEVVGHFQAMREIESGLIYFNAPTTGAEIHLPFGGVKASGNGHRELGTHAVEEFSETKSIFVSYPPSSFGP